MARYAEGYERKSSDTKNLIVLFSIIVAVVVAAVLITLLVNKLMDHTTYDYTSEKYAEFYIDEDHVLKPEQGATEYLIFVCCTEDDADQYVIEYLDAYIEARENGEEDSMLKLYLLDYDAVEDADTVKDKLCGSEDLAETQLYRVVLNENKTVVNSPANRLYDSTTIDEKLKSLLKGNEW